MQSSKWAKFLARCSRARFQNTGFWFPASNPLTGNMIAGLLTLQKDRCILTGHSFCALSDAELDKIPVRKRRSRTTVITEVMGPAEAARLPVIIPLDKDCDELSYSNIALACSAWADIYMSEECKDIPEFFELLHTVADTDTLADVVFDPMDLFKALLR